MNSQVAERITDVERLSDLTLSDHPEVRGIIERKRAHCCVLVSDQLDVYFVAPKHAAQTVALKELISVVRALGPGEQIEITESVFRSYDRAEETNKESSGQRLPQDSNPLVDELLEDAIEASASDIHINIKKGQTEIWFRIHGILVRRARFAASEGQAIVSVMFSVYGNRPFGKEEALDGQFYYDSRRAKPGRSYMVRLNKLQLACSGMTCKCRLRDMHDVVDLDSAGYSDAQQAALREMMALGSGLLIFTGGVNSGKSTTLTALQNKIPAHYAILEISDTIEVQLDHVCHVELPAEGHDLEARISAVQKSSVRQDSDYLVIGEMRDRLTASNAETMGLQGRFVLSTGHASDPISFYLRMISPSDFAMSKETILSPGMMVGIVSQRLIETLCPHCSTAMPAHEAVERSIYETSEALLAELRQGLGSGAQHIRFHKPGGCNECYQSGLSGRTLVAEVMPFNRQVRDHLRAGDFDALRDYLASQGIETKHEHGATKVLAGQIDPLFLARGIGPLGPKTLPRWGRFDE
jgi:type II secretory ATPase GspE/PulE/Tfp pilus assembly ATPase PilB-like protein